MVKTIKAVNIFQFITVRLLCTLSIARPSNVHVQCAYLENILFFTKKIRKIQPKRGTCHHAAVGPGDLLINNPGRIEARARFGDSTRTAAPAAASALITSLIILKASSDKDRHTEREKGLLPHNHHHQLVLIVLCLFQETGVNIWG